MCHFRDEEHEWFAYETEREVRGEAPPPEQEADDDAVFPDEEPEVAYELDRDGSLATDD